MTQCELKQTLTGYTFFWPETKIRVNIERLDDEGHGEFSCWHDNGKGPQLLHISKENFMSTRTMSSLATTLKEHAEIDWKSMLTYVAAETLRRSRQGEPLERLGKKPATMAKTYTLSPILELNQPTTIYGPGASAKSYIAGYIACLVHYNMGSAALNWFPVCGNVLYLDWEATREDHERRIWAIKEGLGIDSEDDMFYRHCMQPLAADILAIQQIVYDNKIALAIIDSQMAASGFGQDPAQVAGQYYNALRSLRCTTLTIDHMDKTSWKNRDDGTPVGPYGSVVKYNRSRSQFEVRKSQNPGDNFVEVSLVHRKHNEGRLLKPIGIRITFEGDPLERVTVSSCDLSQNEMLAVSLSNRVRIAKFLRSGPKTVDAIVEETGISKAVVKNELSRSKDTFVKVGNQEWGVLSQQEFGDEE